MGIDDTLKNVRRFRKVDNAKKGGIPAHAEAQMKHAIRRALERYGFTVLETEYFEICRMIRETIKGRLCSREVKRLKDQRGKRSEWQVKHCGRDFLIVWDDVTKRIVTFLKPEWADNFQKPEPRTVLRVEIPEEG